MINCIYPPTATATGDLSTTEDLFNTGLSRVRLLIDIKPKERLFVPNYGVIVSPFSSSNADFDEAMINYQANLYCKEDLAVNYGIKVGYSDGDQSLIYQIEIT